MVSDSVKRINEMILTFSEKDRDPCMRILDHLVMNFADAPGSRQAHQAWSGGYFDHVAETMSVAVVLHHSMSGMRSLPFSLTDAQLVLFLHDLEKPWKYCAEMRIKKQESFEFRVNKAIEFGITFTQDQLNALRYVEGENDDYVAGQRVMGPLAAFCHMCDICSARIWFDKA